MSYKNTVLNDYKSLIENLYYSMNKKITELNLEPNKDTDMQIKTLENEIEYFNRQIKILEMELQYEA